MGHQRPALSAPRPLSALYWRPQQGGAFSSYGVTFGHAFPATIRPHQRPSSRCCQSECARDPQAARIVWKSTSSPLCVDSPYCDRGGSDPPPVAQRSMPSNLQFVAAVGETPSATSGWFEWPDPNSCSAHPAWCVVELPSNQSPQG